MEHYLENKIIETNTGRKYPTPYKPRVDFNTEDLTLGPLGIGCFHKFSITAYVEFQVDPNNPDLSKRAKLHAKQQLMHMFFKDCVDDLMEIMHVTEEPEVMRKVSEIINKMR